MLVTLDPKRLKPAAGLARAVLRAAPLLALLATLPAQAQFKVVGPDGKVTYTDREPVTQGRVTALHARDGAAVNDTPLPFELRQLATRYPVTLYAASGACEPCESGRQLLRQRGIPYTEKQVLGSEDAEALERLSGGRDAPTLTIGAQVLRGLAPEVWNSYLDAAGYPRVSKLPGNYQARPATPIVERREAAAPSPAPRAEAAATPVERAPTAGGIRF